jgi:hypothetical protein
MSLAREPASYDEVVILAQSSQETFDFPRIVLAVGVQLDRPVVTVNLRIAQPGTNRTVNSQVVGMSRHGSARGLGDHGRVVVRPIVDHQHVATQGRTSQLRQYAAREADSL